LNDEGKHLRQPKFIQVRHRIVEFEANVLTKKLERARCACDFEGSIDQVRSHILKMRGDGTR